MVGRSGAYVDGAVLVLSSVFLVGLLSLFASPALAGVRVYSGELASCAGTGADWDLVATGTVENVEASRSSSRIAVSVERVSGGNGSKIGQVLYVRSDSGIGGGSTADVGFREGARYMLYLQRSGDEWTTNACMGTREIVAEPSASPGLPGTGGPRVLPLAAGAGSLVIGAGVMVRRWARSAGLPER